MEQQKIKPFGDLMKDSWQLYTKHFWKFISMLIVPFAPLLAVLLISAILTPLFPEGSAALGVVNIVMGFLGILATIFLIIAFWVSYAAVFKFIDNPVKDFKLREFLKSAKKMAWPLFVLILASQAVVTFWALLFIIPGIIFSFFYLVAPWTLFKEGFTGVGAIRRSKELVSGYWGPVAGRYVLLILIILIIFMTPVFFITPDTTAEVVYNLISNIVSIAIMPFSLIYVYFIYKDLYKIKGPSKLTDQAAKAKTRIAIIIYLILVFVGFLAYGIASLNIAREKAIEAQQNFNINSELDLDALNNMTDEEFSNFLDSLDDIE